MFRLTITVLIILAISSPARAQDVFDVETVLRGDGDGLSSEEVVARAVDRAPSLDAAEAAITGVESSVQEVWAAILPNVRVGARYTRLSGIVVTAATDSKGQRDRQEQQSQSALGHCSLQ